VLPHALDLLAGRPTHQGFTKSDQHGRADDR
jgi:hypothetical protein